MNISINDIYGNIISVYCYIYGGFFVSFIVFKIKWRYNVIEIFNYVSNVFLYRKVFKLLYLLCFEKMNGVGKKLYCFFYLIYINGI